MEEFRQQTVDRIIIGLITRRILKPSDILAQGPEERILSKITVQKIFEEFMNRLETKVMFDNRKGTLKSFIYSQARNVTRFLIGEKMRYEPFILGW